MEPGGCRGARQEAAAAGVRTSSKLATWAVSVGMPSARVVAYVSTYS
ncbi:MAG: hypothetical protein KatS3mg009_2562 [Acidimicrobiia bacterium]|nr:MAG: hypothetical protein KatS3mg009_2562 [Acidimicrobiia bacterium]